MKQAKQYSAKVNEYQLSAKKQAKAAKLRARAAKLREQVAKHDAKIRVLQRRTSRGARARSRRLPCAERGPSNIYIR